MENTRCGTSGFNYCKVAKTLVAIPALPLIAIMAASFFHQLEFQLMAGISAVVLAVALAIWLDEIPLLKKKFRACSKCDSQD